MKDYHINIFYSDEDEGYIADIPDLQHCSAFGVTPEDALREVETAKAAPDGAGDTWTWTAIEAQTKLIISHFVGGRDGDCAAWFMNDVAMRLANRVQLTSDGHKAYLEAVEGAFGADIDYAM